MTTQETMAIGWPAKCDSIDG